ncbi:MAG: MOSC domain-containing protein [Patescibacteria group bacterium]
MKIKRINLRPVKSLPMMSLNNCLATSTGVRFDSSYMIVDEFNFFVSQRTEDSKVLTQLKITPQTEFSFKIQLGSPFPDIELPFDPTTITVGIPELFDIWGDKIGGVEFNYGISKAFSTVLKKKVKLIAFDCRLIPYISRPRYLSAGQYKRSFQDGYNFSLINTKSLDQLSSWLGIDLNEDSFRANFIADLDEAFFEDNLIGSKIQIGQTIFRVIEHIPRCNIINKNPKTGIDYDFNVIKALAYNRKLFNPHNPNKNIIPFGIGLTMLSGDGKISLESKIHVLDNSR